MFTRLLIGIVNAYNHTKCVLISKQKCMTQLTLIKSHPNKYSQDIYYYPLLAMIIITIYLLGICFGSCSTLNDLSNKVCVLKNRRFKSKLVQHDYENKWIEKINKNISCECKFKSKWRKCNSDQYWNNNKCWCECKKCHVCEKYYVFNFF